MRLVRLCQEFKVLPGPGGLLDQDSYHVWLMEQVVAADREREERDAKQAKAQTPHVRK